MSKHKSAFPGHHWDQEGMTLRDYFAGQVLQGYLTRQTIDPDFENTARLAYMIADAMIKERS